MYSLRRLEGIFRAVLCLDQPVAAHSAFPSFRRKLFQQHYRSAVYPSRAHFCDPINEKTDWFLHQPFALNS